MEVDSFQLPMQVSSFGELRSMHRSIRGRERKLIEASYVMPKVVLPSLLELSPAIEKDDISRKF